MTEDQWPGSSEGEAQALPPDEVLVMISGGVVGRAKREDLLGETVEKFARENGLRSFSVWKGDRKADTSEGNSPIGDVQFIDIVAKDPRGDN